MGDHGATRILHLCVRKGMDCRSARPLGKSIGPAVWPHFDSGVRRFVEVNASKSAELILEAVRAGYVRQCPEAAREFTENLEWDEIAAQWMDLFLDHTCRR